ncbi:MAG: hypothetical protein L3J39_03910 [Verrucomicrobiales bacterium]|nr:hypothetical protein [Verrucomicrobiales bacterium]
MIIQYAFLGTGILFGILGLLKQNTKILFFAIAVGFCFLGVITASVGIVYADTFAIVHQGYDEDDVSEEFKLGAKEARRIATEQLQIFHITTIGLGFLLILQARRKTKPTEKRRRQNGVDQAATHP